MQDINHRNTETVEQALKDMYIKIQTQQIRIDQLNAALSGMTERLNVLEQMLIIQKVKSMGSGPSVI